MVIITPTPPNTKDADPDTDNLGRQLSELIGAVGIYLGELGPTHGGDKERLGRAMTRAVRSQAFGEFMDADIPPGPPDPPGGKPPPYKVA